jgi:hypothetical protein
MSSEVMGLWCGCVVQMRNNPNHLRIRVHRLIGQPVTMIEGHYIPSGVHVIANWADQDGQPRYEVIPEMPASRHPGGRGGEGEIEDG